MASAIFEAIWLLPSIIGVLLFFTGLGMHSKCKSPGIEETYSVLDAYDLEGAYKTMRAAGIAFVIGLVLISLKANRVF